MNMMMMMMNDDFLYMDVTSGFYQINT